MIFVGVAPLTVGLPVSLCYHGAGDEAYSQQNILSLPLTYVWLLVATTASMIASQGSFH